MDTNQNSALIEDQPESVISIAVDAMGGDNAPQVNVDGAVIAAKAHPCKDPSCRR